MRRRRGFAAVIAAVLLITQVAGVAASAVPARPAPPHVPAAPIEPQLKRDLAAGRTKRIVVEFSAKADLKPAAKVKDRGKRGQAVIDALTSTAGTSQRAAKAVAAKIQGVKATTYWLTNVLVVEGDAGDAGQARHHARQGSRRLAGPQRAHLPARRADRSEGGGPRRRRRARVGRRQDRCRQGLGGRASSARASSSPRSTPASTTPIPRSSTTTSATTATGRSPTTTTGGIRPASARTRRPATTSPTAPTRWARSSAATAPARSRRTSASPRVPSGSRPRAARCIDCSESSLLSSGQWVLAPTDLNGENPDPDQRPDIVSNSWGGGPGDSFYLETVQAWRAAGIIPVFSSGNPGPFCGEGGSPGDYLEAFSVGATDEQRRDRRLLRARPVEPTARSTRTSRRPAWTSSRACPAAATRPSPARRWRPRMSRARWPCSCRRTTRCAANFDAATGAIRTTAVDRLDDSCGGDPDGDPNNVYGDGRIDAGAAAALVATGGTLSGTITDTATGDPISGAQVTADDGTRPFTHLDRRRWQLLHAARGRRLQRERRVVRLLRVHPCRTWSSSPTRPRTGTSRSIRCRGSR